jgi:hypothetical protein
VEYQSRFKDNQAGFFSETEVQISRIGSPASSSRSLRGGALTGVAQRISFTDLATSPAHCSTIGKPAK